MDNEVNKILISIINSSIEFNIKNIYEKINEINLKLNRITNKFEYLIELLKEVGDEEEKEEDDY